ncbi:hypothetical protein [Streptomyces sp. NPDC051561]|uniref:hypothetical protein n=1 Tax=Streptomyces sp. NPDC051561 TaxID=3365658 RepID=UPI0037BBAB5A
MSAGVLCPVPLQGVIPSVHATWKLIGNDADSAEIAGTQVIIRTTAWRVAPSTCVQLGALASDLVQHVQSAAPASPMVVFVHLTPHVASVAVVVPGSTLSAAQIGTPATSVPADRCGCVHSDPAGGPVLVASVLPSPESRVSDTPAPPLPLPDPQQVPGLPVRQRATDRQAEGPQLSALWLTAQEAAAQQRAKEGPARGSGSRRGRP